MRVGKRLVITGFFVVLLGVILYCSVGVETTVQADMRWPAVASLGVVGLGTLFWLVGAIVYYIGGIDSDPSGPDLYF